MFFTLLIATISYCFQALKYSDGRVHHRLKTVRNAIPGSSWPATQVKRSPARLVNVFGKVHSRSLAHTELSNCTWWGHPNFLCALFTSDRTSLFFCGFSNHLNSTETERLKIVENLNVLTQTHTHTHSHTTAHPRTNAHRLMTHANIQWVHPALSLPLSFIHIHHGH